MAKICAVGIVTFILHRNVFQMIVNILRLAHTTMAHTKKPFFISGSMENGEIFTNTDEYQRLFLLEKSLKCTFDRKASFFLSGR